MLRTVIDTNVVVSGLISPGSRPELILMMILETGHVRPCLSDDIFSEYKRVLDYDKFRKYLERKKSGKFSFPVQGKKHMGETGAETRCHQKECLQKNCKKMSGAYRTVGESETGFKESS